MEIVSKSDEISKKQIYLMIAKKSDRRFLYSLHCTWFMWLKLYIILSVTEI